MRKLNSIGIGLVEVLVALGVLSLLGIGVASLMSSAFSSTKMARLTSTRDILVRELNFTISNIKTYNQSMAADLVTNSDLSICINGDPSPTPKLCKALTAAGGPPTQTGFVIYPPMSNQAISGKLGSPLTYTDQGRPCTSDDAPSNCPLSVETWFQADCAGNVDCIKATDLQFFYVVKSNEESKYRLKPVSNSANPAVYSSLVRGSVWAQTTNVVTPPSVQCSVTSYVGTGVVQSCCMTIGLTTKCKIVPAPPDGTTFRSIDFSGAFGAWKLSSESSESLDYPLCGDLSAPCGLGSQCQTERPSGRTSIWKCK